MSAAEKGRHWQALKQLNITFDRPYQYYKLEELKVIHQAYLDLREQNPELVAQGVQAADLLSIPPPKNPNLEEIRRPTLEAEPPPRAERSTWPPPQVERSIEEYSRAERTEMGWSPPTPQRAEDAEIAAYLAEQYPKPEEESPVGVEAMQTAPPPLPPPGPTRRPPPLRAADPNEMAGQRQSADPEEPIRVDEEGRIWLQEEIRKPAFPKPRGRRVLTYLEPGVQQETIKVGDYVETFEVAGTGAPRTAEVKITLPSYQVGIYKDPRFPFKIHTYNGANGFDLNDVQDYYGGAELIPAGVKRTYIENVLCYDIRTVVRAINEEYRQQVLAGRIKE